MNFIDVALCCDAHFRRPAAVTIQSVLDHAGRPGAFRFWLVTPGIAPAEAAPLMEIAQAQGAELHFVDCSQEHARMQAARIDRHLTAATYYRLFLPDLLPLFVERVIYLDSDVIVRADLERLFQEDLGDCILGAVLNPLGRHFRNLGLTRASDYFNAGVLLWDLARFRQGGQHRHAVNYALENPRKLSAADQDALNHVLAGQWHRLDLRWNQQTKFFRYTHWHMRVGARELSRARHEPFIVHFTSKLKPWHYEDCHPWRHVWFESLDRTPFRGWRPPRGDWPAQRRRVVRWLLPMWLHPTHVRSEYWSRCRNFGVRCRRWLTAATKLAQFRRSAAEAPGGTAKR